MSTTSERRPSPSTFRGVPRTLTVGARGVGRRPPRLFRIREELPRRQIVALMAVSIIAPLAVWWAFAEGGTVSDIFLPSPPEVFTSLRTMIADGTIPTDAALSVRRTTIGFGLAVLISVPLGLLMGSFKSVEALCAPAISFIRYMPGTAFVVLLLIWLGIGEPPKIALIVIGVVFFNTLMTANVVWQVPTEMIRVAYTLGARNVDVLRKVIFPHAIPGIIDAARVNLAAAWNLIVVAEMFNATDGLGVRIVRLQKFLRTDDIFAVLLVIGVIGLISDQALRLLRDRLAPWSQE